MNRSIDEMWDVLSALTDDISIRRSINKRWYISMGKVEIKQGGVLSSGPSALDGSPDEAIASAFDYYTSLPNKNGECVVINAYGGNNRRELLWNGHMWKDLPK